MHTCDFARFGHNVLLRVKAQGQFILYSGTFDTGKGIVEMTLHDSRKGQLGDFRRAVLSSGDTRRFEVQD
jgi:hypothetical protein